MKSTTKVPLSAFPIVLFVLFISCGLWLSDPPGYSPLLTSRQQVRPSVPFVLQIPTPPNTTGFIIPAPQFGSAHLIRADVSQETVGPSRTIPPSLQRDLNALYRGWCRGAGPIVDTPDPAQPTYEVSFLCLSDTQTIYTIQIPGNQLPPALGALVRLTYWQ